MNFHCPLLKCLGRAQYVRITVQLMFFKIQGLLTAAIQGQMAPKYDVTRLHWKALSWISFFRNDSQGGLMKTTSFVENTYGCFQK